MSWRQPAHAARDIEAVLPRLQQRDYQIVLLLGRHKVFTLHQIQRLFFTSRSAARDRVNTLFELGVLRRFRPASTRAAYRYALSHLGRGIYVSFEDNHLYLDPNGNREVKVPTKAMAEQAFVRLASSRHRRHLEAINDFFVRLIVGLRARSHNTGQAWELTEWEPERHIGKPGQRPDGAGTITYPDGKVVTFWFEHDTGNEPLHMLVRKVRHYRDEPLKGRAMVLFQLHSQTREANLHNALDDEHVYPLAVATTITNPNTDPTAEVWWHYGEQNPRPLGITDLVKPEPVDPRQIF